MSKSYTSSDSSVAPNRQLRTVAMLLLMVGSKYLQNLAEANCGISMNICQLVSNLLEDRETCARPYFSVQNVQEIGFYDLRG
jgi:hypothetical protein